MKTVVKTTKYYRVLVCGDRNWTDRDFLYDELDKLADFKYPPVIIHGAAKGADTMAGDWAHSRLVLCEAYPAQWKKYGKSAGPIRNQQMIDEGKPDLVLAFHNDLRNSKGTRDMVLRARRHKIKVEVLKSR